MVGLPSSGGRGMKGQRIVIIGGGFGGIAAARRLEKRLPDHGSITLISAENHITYSPLLAEVAGAAVLPGHAVAPLRQMVRRTRVLMGEVEQVDLEGREIRCFGGDGPIEFDQLVLAPGRAANVDLLPGMAEHALPLKTPGDALHVRNRLIGNLERAEFEDDADRCHRLTTFAVIGGGASGVEVAGAIHDFLDRAHRYYQGTSAEDFRVVLLHDGPRILPELSEELGRYAERKMRARGIEIRTGCAARSVSAAGVELPDGEILRAGTVISTVGTRPHPLVEHMALPMEGGKIRVAADLAVPGHPGVWALGDCASIPNRLDGDRPCPPTAQFADRQGRWLADNLVARLRGGSTRPFAFEPLGQLASIGHHTAVAELHGWRFSGFVGWLLWRGVYLMKMPTLARKVRVFGEWNWNMLFPPDVARLSLRRTGEPAELD